MPIFSGLAFRLVPTLKIINCTSLDAVAAVTGESSPGGGLAMIYVRALQEAVIHDIGPGRYFVTFKAGAEWEPKSQGFVGHQFTSGCIGPFRFVQVQGAEGIQSDRFEVVLTPR